ncbi:hypothetical protein, partial [Clostridium sp.]|uniref:hypothetical protein n=1 Tax=Clostridium sp. TaxID=1506 RepID=UPI003EEB5C81
MEKFAGKRDSIIKLGSIFAISALLAIVSYLYISNLTLKIIMLLIFILSAFNVYMGLLLSITVDE